MFRTWSRILPTLAVGVLAPATVASAQDPEAREARTIEGRRITLDEALRWLESANLELRVAREDVAAAHARVVSAGMLPNPDLTGSREQLSSDGERYHETLLSVGQRMEIGGQRGARREVAGHTVEAAEARLEAERRRLGFEVRRAYVRGAVAEGDLVTLGEATAVFRRVEESGRARFAEGDISRFDRSRLQIERARYETLLARARLALNESARELALLVAPDSLAAAVLLPAEPLTGIEAVDRALALDAALASAVDRAELRAAAAEVEAARATLSLARRERIPDLTLSGGYKRQADGFQGAVLGVAIPVPLWNRNQGEIAGARARLDAALARRELALARAQVDIRRAWDTHRSLQERISTLGEALLPDAAGLLETARVAYAEGEMSLVELLDAADAYRSARESVNQLLGDYLISVFDLQRATGRLPGQTASNTEATPRTERP